MLPALLRLPGDRLVPLSERLDSLASEALRQPYYPRQADELRTVAAALRVELRNRRGVSALSDACAHAADELAGDAR
jgi:hypothetical protein